MMRSYSSGDNKARAAGFALLAVGLASTQDAVVKAMSGTYPVYETMIIRACVALPILGIWLTLALGLRALASPLWPRILLRALILCSAYLSYILSMAAMPMANTVAIYFTMPFFVAGLARPFFGERVPLYRWIAITAGFAGVIVMVRPGMRAFEPASLLALYSAFGYAVGQMMGRKLAQEAPPLVIANWQNAVYLTCSVLVGLAAQATGFAGEGHKSLAFLTRPWVSPSLPDFLLLSFLGVLAAFTIVSFVSAYKFAESSFVAPFEYSSMAWAILFGLLFFTDFPDLLTWAGMAIVVGAGLFMLIMDRRARLQTG
jgi:drug/metabolite transporter (DMT)-like permease